MILRWHNHPGRWCHQVRHVRLYEPDPKPPFPFPGIGDVDTQFSVMILTSLHRAPHKFKSNMSGAVGNTKSKASTSFCEQKEAKKLWFPEAFDANRRPAKRNQKFFASFFQKRSAFLYLQTAFYGRSRSANHGNKRRLGHANMMNEHNADQKRFYVMSALRNGVTTKAFW